MQRMSGIATKTSKIINLISDFNVKLLDTENNTKFKILRKMGC